LYLSNGVQFTLIGCEILSQVDNYANSADTSKDFQFTTNFKKYIVIYQGFKYTDIKILF